MYRCPEGEKMSAQVAGKVEGVETKREMWRQFDSEKRIEYTIEAEFSPESERVCALTLRERFHPEGSVNEWIIREEGGTIVAELWMRLRKEKVKIVSISLLKIVVPWFLQFEDLMKVIKKHGTKKALEAVVEDIEDLVQYFFVIK